MCCFNHILSYPNFKRNVASKKDKVLRGSHRGPLNNYGRGYNISVTESLGNLLLKEETNKTTQNNTLFIQVSDYYS